MGISLTFIVLLALLILVVAPPPKKRPQDASASVDDSCGGSSSGTCSFPPHYLFLNIISARENSEKRTTLRETWLKKCSSRGPNDCGFKFFIGKSSSDGLDSAIEAERRKFGDIIILNVEDGYKNLVHKVVASLVWAFENVQFTYWAKTDDDVFMLSDRMLGILRGLPSQKRVYLGSRLNRSKPWRKPTDKYYTPTDKYYLEELPPYVEGPCYVLSRDLTEYIHRNRNDLQPFTHVDDPVVALWLLAIQVHPQHNNGWMTGSAMNGRNCDDRVTTLIPNLQLKTIRNLWAAHERTATICSALHTS